MKRIFLIFILFSFSFVTAQTKYDTFFKQTSEGGNFNGTVLLADKDGIVYKGAFGKANFEWGVNHTTDTKFRLASVSKQFAATLIMQLVEKGKLSLDTKLSDVLPYYRKDVGEKVTIKHLLDHSSGIPSYTGFPEFMNKDAYHFYPTKEFVQKYCSNDLDYEPGEKFSYNNSGYYLLGAILEHHYGKSFADVTKEQIFEPLEMTNSGYDRYRPIIKKRASAYVKRFNGYLNAQFIDMSAPGAAGGLYSTVEDMYKWDRALLEYKLISEETTKQMYTVSSGSYGYGWFLETYAANSKTYNVVQHGGGINGFSTMIYRIPDEKISVVMLTNVAGTSCYNLIQQVLNIYYNDKFELSRRSAAEYVFGLYENDNSIDVAGTLKALMNEENETFKVDERMLNALGYEFLNQQNKPKIALDIFKYNTELFPKSGNTWDSYAETYLVLKDTVNSIKYYQKSVDINPANQHGLEVLKSLGVEQKSAAAEITPELVKLYSGDYQIAAGFILTITGEPGQLYGQATGQPKIEIYSKTKTEFYYKVVDAQILFTVEDGVTKSLTLFQGGREMVAPKIK